MSTAKLTEQAGGREARLVPLERAQNGGTVTITVQETIEETSGATVPERSGFGLLGWIHERDLRSAFQGLPVTSPGSAEEFIAAWRARPAANPATSPMAPAGQSAREPSPQLAPRIADLQATDQYRALYQPFGAVFATVNISELITPQWWTDIEYVDELAATLSPEGDLEGLFSFCFPGGQLAPPIMLGAIGAAFASSRHNLGAISPLRVAQRSADKITFQFDVTPRANWVWLATVACLPRPMIINGVHHLLALLKAGRTEAPCLMCSVQTPLDLQVLGMNYQDPFLFKPDQLASARPPLLRDYLDPTMTLPVGRHASDQYMRVVLNAEIGVVPKCA